MRTTITIDEDLYRRLKASAARRGRTVSELIEDAVRDALRPRRPSGSEPTPLPTFGGSGVLPGVDLSDLRSLVDVMDEDTPVDALR
jgi:Ribbon-helix-helix protein, copG family